MKVSYGLSLLAIWLDEQVLWVSSLTGYPLFGRISVRKVLKQIPVHD